MNNTSGHRWLDKDAIMTALSRHSAPESQVVGDILDKSLALEPLGLDEITALLRVKDHADLVRIMGTADLVKQKAYGDRIVISAPLHVDNHCASECLYCAYQAGNSQIERKRLTPAQIREAADDLIRQGHKRVVLVSGQSARPDMAYFAEAIEILGRVAVGQGEIRRVNIDIGALEPGEYEELKGTEAGTVNIFQETYHERSYKKAHPAGPKSDFDARLHAPGVAFECGMKDVGLGLTFGLGPADFDILALSRHVAHLSAQYGIGARTVNLHRCRPAPGCSYDPPHALNDEEFLRMVAITRLAIPWIGIILTTKEPDGIWRGGCDAGASQLLTGSLANPYVTWIEGLQEKAVFPAGTPTHLDEVVRFLLEESRHLPSFCTACPRLGRNGEEFIAMAASGDIKTQCGPNSMASFMEFLLNYATPYTREMGEKLIAEKLAKMDSHERHAAERLLEKVRAGRTDEFI